MSKGFNGRMPGGMGGMNMNQLLKQAKKMQEEMEKSQEDLASKTFESTAGGGAVYAKVNGTKQLEEIRIKPEVIDPEDPEMPQDLILTCVNDALRKVDQATNEAFGKYNIPGLGI